MLLLAGYLVLFPPLFVLAPLAGLLAASRPRTLREWAWIAVGGLWLAVSLWQPGGLATQTLHAWALFVTAAFVMLMLSAGHRLVSGALLAAISALGTVTLWVWLLDSGWRDIRLAVAHNGWEACRQLLATSGALREDLPDLRAFADALADGVGVIADLFPAILVLTVLPGLALAWSWYHRLAARPTGAPTEQFADFRFNDQAAWAVVLSVAVFVLPAPPVLRDVVSNLALVVGGLYTARGTAVIWSSVRQLSTPVLLLIFLGILFILPVAVGGCFALGLADTWVDFRRRQRSADLTRE